MRSAGVRRRDWMAVVAAVACASTLEGNGGNPWAIDPVIDSADIRPSTGNYCDTGNSYGNPWNDG